MPVLTIEDFAEAIETGRPLAGLDLGTKTIGLAISDRSLGFAVPRPVIKRRKFTLDAEELRKALDKEEVAGIVLGLPLNMDGSNGPRAQSTKAFARSYGAMWDERLSTVAAERGLLEADVSRAKRATRIDSAAAAFILQGALDRLAHLFSADGD